MKFPVLVFAAALLGGALLLACPETADGGPQEDAALRTARARGKVLFEQRWRPGQKSCLACHGAGRNKLTVRRMQSYPKYDRPSRKVVSGQQKLNQMIVEKSKGAALPLGSADMNALEAYVVSIMR